MTSSFLVQCLRDDQTEGLHFLGHWTECCSDESDVTQESEDSSRRFHTGQSRCRQ